MIRPLRDLIVLDPESPPGKIGLLYIPDIKKSTKNQTFYYARVVAHGPKTVAAKTGTRVLVSEYGGDPVEDGGRKLIIIRERDIVGLEVN